MTLGMWWYGTPMPSYDSSPPSPPLHYGANLKSDAPRYRYCRYLYATYKFPFDTYAYTRWLWHLQNTFPPIDNANFNIGDLTIRRVPFSRVLPRSFYSLDFDSLPLTLYPYFPPLHLLIGSHFAFYLCNRVKIRLQKWWTKYEVIVINILILLLDNNKLGLVLNDLSPLSKNIQLILFQDIFTDGKAKTPSFSKTL